MRHINVWQTRAPRDRRSIQPRRKDPGTSQSFTAFGLPERAPNDRRKGVERRKGWIRLNDWHSVSVFAELYRF